jgi:protein required for attachment to host cells
MPKHPSQWVLVANGHKACILSIKKKTEVSLIKEYETDALPTRELVSDRPGRSFDRRGDGRHAMEPPTDAHRQTSVRFLVDVAAFLDQERLQNHYQQLIVIAAPAALGVLRKHFSKPVHDAIIREIPADLTQYRFDELPAYLEKLEGQ